MSSVVLLGDSIFDNGSYTNGEPDVASHLRALLPSWRVTLCAVDGTTTSDIGPQLDRLPKDATHVLLSLGKTRANLRPLLDPAIERRSQKRERSFRHLAVLLLD